MVKIEVGVQDEYEPLDEISPTRSTAEEARKKTQKERGKMVLGMKTIVFAWRKGG